MPILLPDLGLQTSVMGSQGIREALTCLETQVHEINRLCGSKGGKLFSKGGKLCSEGYILFLC